MSYECEIIGPEKFNVGISIDEPLEDPVAVALLCSDYRGSRSDPHLVALGQAAAKAGIVAARFDQVGAEGGGGIEDDSLLTRHIRRIATVRQHMDNTYEARDVIVGGHGIGGLASIVYASRAAAQGVATRAVVAICPPKEVRGMESSASATIPSRASAIGDVRTSATAAVRFYPKSTSLLLIAGTLDRITPVKDVLEIYRAAPTRRAHCSSLVIGTDYYVDRQQVDDVTARVMGWLGAILDLRPAPRRTS